MSDFVTIYEVGPRDGLQNEPHPIATQDKIALINQLSQAGFDYIEATSFVSRKWVPQLGDAREVMTGITRQPKTVYAALTPNMRGFDAARASGVGEVAIFGAASESFSQKNINCSIAESFERFAPIIAAAKDAGIAVRGYVSCVTDCPYEGVTDPKSVAAVAAKMYQMGCREISLGETLGRAAPDQVTAMLEEVLAQVPATNLAGHFHDTSGRAVAHILYCLAQGVRVFDAAIGGLGGCPYAPGASGNVATEAVVHALSAEGYRTGLDIERLASIAKFARSLKGGR